MRIRQEDFFQTVGSISITVCVVCVCEREIHLNFATGTIAASVFATSIVNLRLITLYMKGQTHQTCHASGNHENLPFRLIYILLVANM